LIVWRRQLEARHRFDPNKAIAPADITAVQRDIDVQGTKLEQEIASGLANLRAIVAAGNSRRQALEGQAAELMSRYAQAAADAAVMPVSPNTHKGLIALAGAAIGVTLFSLIPNKAPQAQSTQPQIHDMAPPVALTPTPQRQPVVVTPGSPAPSVSAVPAVPPAAPEEPAIPLAQDAVRFPMVQSQNPHVQTRQAVNMRSAPDNASAVVRTVPQGTVLSVFSRRNGWVQVGEEAPWGWIYTGLLADAP
jgi:hypothetical protein